MALLISQLFGDTLGLGSQARRLCTTDRICRLLTVLRTRWQLRRRIKDTLDPVVQLIRKVQQRFEFLRMIVLHLLGVLEGDGLVLTLLEEVLEGFFQREVGVLVVLLNFRLLAQQVLHLVDGFLPGVVARAGRPLFGHLLGLWALSRNNPRWALAVLDGILTPCDLHARVFEVPRVHLGDRPMVNLARTDVENGL